MSGPKLCPSCNVTDCDNSCGLYEASDNVSMHMTLNVLGYTDDGPSSRMPFWPSDREYEGVLDRLQSYNEKTSIANFTVNKTSYKAIKHGHGVTDKDEFASHK